MRAQTWKLLNDDFNMTSRQYYYGHIFADPQDVDTVYTFCAKYFYKSTDGGKTYTRSADAARRLPRPVDRPARSSAHGERQRRRRGGHVQRRPHVDARSTTSPRRSSTRRSPTTAFRTGFTDRSRTTRTVSIASRTDGAGITEHDWHPVGGGESGYIAPTPPMPPVVFGGSYFGLMTRYRRADRRDPQHDRLARLQRRPHRAQTSSTAFSGPIRSSSRRTMARRCTPARRCCSGRRTRDRAGRRSAPT